MFITPKKDNELGAAPELHGKFTIDHATSESFLLVLVWEGEDAVRFEIYKNYEQDSDNKEPEQWTRITDPKSDGITQHLTNFSLPTIQRILSNKDS